mgnify:CR=1 FL=1
MDLEELKASWKHIGEENKPMSAVEIKKIVAHSSISPMAKIRKNMMFELIAILVVLVGFFVFVLLKEQPTNVLYLGLGVLTAISLFILLFVFPKFYRHTKKVDVVHSVSTNLYQNITKLQSDLELYEKTMLFLYVPACFAGFALSNYFNKYIVLFFVVFFPVYYFLVKKWTKFFYGQYVEELEELVQELQQVEEE